MRRWLIAVGEMEALSSLAGYHYEHPDDVFPDLSAGTPCFDAQGLGHPLVSEAVMVRNDVRLAFRTIARDTDERTLIFSLLPKDVGLGHSLFANAGKTYKASDTGDVYAVPVSPLRLLLALAWLNSVPVDWLSRQMIQNYCCNL